MRKLIIGLMLVVNAFGAITFDTSVDGTFGTGVSFSVSYTVTTGCVNPILFASVLGDNQSSDTLGTDITGGTYNAVAMTLINKQYAIGDRWVYLFYLVNPTVGSAHNITFLNSAAGLIGIKASSYCGAKQTGVPDASAVHQASDAPDTTTLTTIANNSWTVIAVKNGNGNNPTSGAAGTTIRQSSSGWAIADSNGPITPAGSTSLVINCAGCVTPPWGTAMASFAPVAAAATFISNPTIITVGP